MSASGCLAARRGASGRGPAAPRRSKSPPRGLRGRGGKHSTIGSDGEQVVGGGVPRQHCAEGGFHLLAACRADFASKHVELVEHVAELVLHHASHVEAVKPQVGPLLRSGTGGLPLDPEGEDTEQWQEGGGAEQQELALDRPPHHPFTQRFSIHLTMRSDRAP